MPAQEEIGSRRSCGMRAIEAERAVDEHLLRERVYAEGVAVPNDDIRSLAGLERADAIVETERLRGIEGQPANCAFRRDRQSNARTMRHRLGSLLVQALNAIAGIGVHDGATVFG